MIIAADDVPIDSAADLAKLLATRKPGDELDLELIDSRGPRLVTVTLAKRRRALAIRWGLPVATCRSSRFIAAYARSVHSSPSSRGG